VSKEETRYYLNGVYVEPHADGGVTMTATDGHRLLCIYDKEGYIEKPTIIRLKKHALAACKPGKGEAREIHLTGNSVVVKIVRGADESRVEEGVSISEDCIIDGVYPNYRHVVTEAIKRKDSADHKFPSLNSKYLVEFSIIGSRLAKAGGVDIGLIKILSAGQREPVRVLFGGFEDAFGILMPTRGSDKEDLPPFLNAAAAEACAA
jgi:hypothetical protein